MPLLSLLIASRVIVGAAPLGLCIPRARAGRTGRAAGVLSGTVAVLAASRPLGVAPALS